MEDLNGKLEEYDDVITLDSDEVIDRFFVLSLEEKNLARGLKIHKSMEGKLLKRGECRTEPSLLRLYLGGPGVYVIKCKANDKSYIGQSVNVLKRIQKHSAALNTGNHYNIQLQRAFDEYGGENFIFVQLESVLDKQKLCEREQYWDTIYRGSENGFNQIPTNPDLLQEFFTTNGHPTFKLDKDKARTICEHINAGLNVDDIAKEYGISVPAIWGIRKGRNWRNIGDKYLSKEIKDIYWENNATLKLFHSDVVKICNDINSGMKIPEIATKYKLGRTTIDYIRNGTFWRNVGESILSEDVKNRYWKNIMKRLPKEKAIEICNLINQGKNTQEISILIGFSKGTVERVRNGELFAELGQKYLNRETIQRYWNNKRKTLSKNEVMEICKDLNSRLSVRKIAEKRNVSHSAIYNIKKGATFADLGAIYLCQ